MDTDTNPTPVQKSKRVRVNQSDFPQLPINKALGILQTIWDQYNGNPTAPYDVAIAMNLAPTSGGWRNLTGTSVAYGLTEGGYGATTITITALGKRIVAPTEPNDDMRARREAVLKPNIMRSFYEKYNHGKFPEQKIAENILVSLGLPKERASAAVEILRENGLATGILRETTTGSFVALDEPIIPTKSGIVEGKSEIPMPKDISELGKPGKVTFGKGLYVNFEIHIAADTPIDTIVAIFENMKKYLLDNE